MDDHRTLPSLARARDTVEALNSEHRAPRSGIFWAMAAAAGALLAALPLVHLTVTVRAAGIVRPVEDAVEVRAPAAGLLAKVFVREFATVEKGQPLVELAAPEIDERLRHLGRQLAELDAVRADLGVLTAEPAAAASVGAEGERAELRTPLYRRERAQYQAALRAAATDGEKLERDLARAAYLHSRGLFAERELDAARFAVEQHRADTDALRGQTLARWQAELRQHENTSATLRAEERALCDAKALRVVRAAATGDLLGFNGWRPGVFVVEGQPLGAISPSGALHIEATVRSRDLAQLRDGLPARVEVDAFPATEWGFLDGAIESVARDVQYSGGAQFHRVVVRLSEARATNSGPPYGRLQKGMAATVRVVVGQRSLWHYLTETADRWLDDGPKPRTVGANRSRVLRSATPAGEDIPLAARASRRDPTPNESRTT